MGFRQLPKRLFQLENQKPKSKKNETCYSGEGEMKGNIRVTGKGGRNSLFHDHKKHERRMTGNPKKRKHGKPGGTTRFLFFSNTSGNFESTKKSMDLNSYTYIHDIQVSLPVIHFHTNNNQLHSLIPILSFLQQSSKRGVFDIRV